jgi:ribosome-binding factor A
VSISADYTYADISVMSQRNVGTLPKFLAPTEKGIRKRLAKDYKIWKIPHLRFRIDQKEKSANTILALIHSLDTQYGLSHEHT